MKQKLLALAAVLVAFCQPAMAENAPVDTSPAACVLAAAAAYDLPPALVVILLKVEGGTLGRVSQNKNGTVDIGPMQINDIWLPKLETHWDANLRQTYEALRDDFCANVEAGSWILSQAVAEDPSDFWRGVGYYHSHTPALADDYLRLVAAQAFKLERPANRSSPDGAGGRP